MVKNERCRTSIGLFVLSIMLGMSPLFAQTAGGDKPVVPVTFYWQASDVVDVYLNGSPLRTTLLDFRMRADESAKPAFSAIGLLSDGDILIAGVRGGAGGHGFTMVIVDSYNRVVWKTDSISWSVFSPPTDGSSWYDPIRRANTVKRIVMVSFSPTNAQMELNARFGNPAYCIQDPALNQIAYFYSNVAFEALPAPAVPVFVPSSK